MTLFDDLPPAPPRPDLPEIVGTPKQRPWATDVRNRLLRDCERYITERRRMAEYLEITGAPEKAAPLREELRRHVDALAQLEGETSARFWIDRRELAADELLRLAVGDNDE